MCDLCNIAFKYKTDKCPRIKHHFTEHYHSMFKDRRDSVRKVLEVGIGLMEPYYVVGASLYMWREYFPNAQICGIDILADLIFEDERIMTYLCDQTDKDSMHKLISIVGSDIDLFIDDGNHTPESQVATCLTVMPLLDKNVTYVIEDVGVREIVNQLGLYDVEIMRPPHKSYNDDHMVVVRHHV